MTETLTGHVILTKVVLLFWSSWESCWHTFTKSVCVVAIVVLIK